MTDTFSNQVMSTGFVSGKKLSPVELVVLQGTSLCNLNCKYCDLSVQSRRTKALMEPKLIERLFTQLFASELLAPEVTVIWHSGEPLTLPPSYYDEAIELILRLRDTLSSDPVCVKFDMQTNGTLIDDGWCQFFKRHKDRLVLGVSCDGPSELHDLFRLNWAGRATHSQTIRGMDLLQDNGLKYKMIGVVTGETLRQPELFYKFFFDRREYLSAFHFNILAAGESDDPALSYSADDRSAYYAFYRRMLELNRETQAAGHDFEVLNFSQGTARILASKHTDAPGYLDEAIAPLKSLNVDTLGNVTTFYAGLSVDVLRDAYGDGIGLSLGNIFDVSFADMAGSDKLQRILRDFALSTRTCEAACGYFSVCSGGFEITKKKSFGTFEVSETAECVIHVKTLVDALLDDIDEYLELQPA
jgi:uncharacterized protein